MGLELAWGHWSWNLWLLDTGMHSIIQVTSGTQFSPVCILLLSVKALDPNIIVHQIWVGDCYSLYSLDCWPNCGQRRYYIGPPDKFHHLLPGHRQLWGILLYRTRVYYQGAKAQVISDIIRKGLQTGTRFQRVSLNLVWDEWASGRGFSWRSSLGFSSSS